MYTLYGEPGSGSFMIEAALAEAGAAVRLVDLDLSAGEQLKPAYRRMSPLGRVPCLVTPQGETLTESPAILITLAERHARARLLPRPGSPERAMALRWMAFIASHIYEAVTRSDYPERYMPDPSCAAAVRAKARADLRAWWRIVDAALPGGAYALPTGFSALDLMIANVSGWCVGKGWRARRAPKLEAVAQAVSERPKLRAVWARHWAR